MKILFLALFLLTHQAHAFRLTPMVVDFAPQGKGTTQTVTLENPGNSRIAVQLEIMKRAIDVNGKENRSEPSSDFVLYPEQLVLEAGQKRNVRITWVGEAEPKVELPFRLVASQLPVALERPTNRADVKVNLKFVLQYVASLYVVPPEAKSRIVVTSASVKDGKAEVMLENEGNTRRLLEGARIRLTSGAETYEVPEEEMKEVRAQNILAGGSRRFRLSVPKQFKDIRAEIRFD